MPAVKLLFRVVDRAEATEMLESFDDSLEVNLLSSDLSALMDELARTNALLPPQERTFKEWTVGLLAKWQGTR